MTAERGILIRVSPTMAKLIKTVKAKEEKYLLDRYKKRHTITLTKASDLLARDYMRIK